MARSNQSSARCLNALRAYAARRPGRLLLGSLDAAHRPAAVHGQRS